jgi:CubicO group peptidase (beta-lactamase class C family)
MLHNLSSKIDSFVERVREHWKVPGVAVAVVNEGVPVHVRAYGVASLAGRTAADNHTEFPIGSCSKAFTSFAAAMLVDSGVINWDDSLRKFLPTLKLHDAWVAEHITIRDVLANRSGLSRASLAEYGSDLTLPEVIEYAREIQPTCEFRDQFSYCNVGFIAAAEALSAAVGLPYGALLRERLFAPLGFKSGGPVPTGRQTATNVAAPHYVAESGVIEVPAMPLTNLMGASGQTLSAHDAAIWLTHQLGSAPKGEAVVSQAALEETHLLQVPRRDRGLYDGYGLGWDVRSRPGRHLLHHEGEGRGFRTDLWLDPEHRRGAFVATNLGIGLSHAAIAGFLHRLLRGQEKTDLIAQIDDYRTRAFAARRADFNRERSDEPISGSPFLLEQFCGTYRHKGFGCLHIARETDHLTFHIGKLSNFDGPLVRYSGLGFEYQGDRNALAWPPIAIPHTPTGDLFKVRFHACKHRIECLDWFAWFGQARFQRIAS